MNKKTKITLISSIISIAVIAAIIVPVSISFTNRNDTFSSDTFEKYDQENPLGDNNILRMSDTDIQYTSDATHAATYLNVVPIKYNDVCNPGNSSNFYSSRIAGGVNASDYGFVPGTDVYSNVKITPYLSGTAQSSVDVIPYCAACENGRHLFSYIDVITDGTFQFVISFTTLAPKTSVKVLPESRGINATISSNKVTATINDVGDYTFIFNDSPDCAYTFQIQYKSPFKVPNGYNLSYMEPGKYGYNFTTFETPNSYIVFKAGTYDIQGIQLLESNITVYFEEGCYFRAHAVNDPSIDALYCLFTKTGIDNANVLGRALFDFSQLKGGDNSKGIVNINSNNSICEGLILINSSHWSLTVCDALLPEIRYNLLLSFRTYSDGIMTSNCRGEIPEGSDEAVYARIHHNFCRVGDDGLEVKSTSSHQIDKNYVKYDHNTVWTDKGYAYGLTYESIGSASNIVFEHNSVGFSQAAWSDRCGVFVIQMGTNGASEFHNVTFDDIEIYKASKHLAVVHVTDEDQEASKDVGTTVYNPEYGGCVSNIKFNNIRYKSLAGKHFWAYFYIGSSSGTKAYNSFVNNLYFNNIYENGVKLTSLTQQYSGNRSGQVTGIYLDDNKIR